MDPLLIIGDLVHILALLYLLFTILTARSATGVSYRTQEMFLLVFIARFSDIVITDIPLHLQLLLVRTCLIATTIAIIYFVRLRSPKVSALTAYSYNREVDAFPHLWIYAGTAILSLVIPENRSPYGYLWTFSIWLEAFSIIPQLYMLFKQSQIQNWTTNFIIMLGVYRGLYLTHWYACGYVGLQIRNMPKCIEWWQQPYRLSFTVYSCIRSMQGRKQSSLWCYPNDLYSFQSNAESHQQKVQHIMLIFPSQISSMFLILLSKIISLLTFLYYLV